MTDWHKAAKRPAVVEYREPNGREEIETREGTVVAVEGDDYVIRGVEGELYPIGKDVFAQSYNRVPDDTVADLWVKQ
jgi:hypothetical protein